MFEYVSHFTVCTVYTDWYIARGQWVFSLLSRLYISNSVIIKTLDGKHFNRNGNGNGDMYPKKQTNIMNTFAVHIDIILLDIFALSGATTNVKTSQNIDKQ